jgi:hypothetical protein
MEEKGEEKNMKQTRKGALEAQLERLLHGRKRRMKQKKAKQTIEKQKDYLKHSSGDYWQKNCNVSRL